MPSGHNPERQKHDAAGLAAILTFQYRRLMRFRQRQDRVPHMLTIQCPQRVI